MGAFASMGLTIHVVIAAFAVVIVAGLPAWFSEHPRKVPKRTVHHIGQSGPKHKRTEH